MHTYIHSYTSAYHLHTPYTHTYIHTYIHTHTHTHTHRHTYLHTYTHKPRHTHRQRGAPTPRHARDPSLAFQKTIYIFELWTCNFRNPKVVFSFPHIALLPVLPAFCVGLLVYVLEVRYQNTERGGLGAKANEDTAFGFRKVQFSNFKDAKIKFWKRQKLVPRIGRGVLCVCVCVCVGGAYPMAP